jgi:hypothetical protein
MDMRSLYCSGSLTNSYKIFAGKPEGNRHAEDLGVNGRMILE